MLALFRNYFRFPLLIILCILLTGLCLFPVHADGGAPQLAYVSGASHGISVIDIAQQRVTRTIAIEGDPHVALLSLDGHALYVTQPTLGRVSVLTVKTGKVLCTVGLAGQPSLLALSLDATMLYVAGRGDTRVRALDPTTCAIRRAFETHERVYGLAVAASTAMDATPATPNQLWIAGSTSLTVFDVTGHLLGTLPIAGGPQDISIPGGFTAYVTTRQGTVVAVDLGARRVIRTLLTNGKFGPMDYDATTGEIYVPDQQHNRLDVLTPVTMGTTVTPREPARVLPLDSSPQSVAITSDGLLGFVALANGHTLMLDVPGRRILKDITVGGTPHFIVTGLYPPATSSASNSHNASFPINGILSIILGILLLGVFWAAWRRYRS